MKQFNRDNRFEKRSSGRSSDERSSDDRTRRFGRGNSFQSERRSSDRFERKYPERPFEKKMHAVTCAKCGERCEVPFKPRDSKSVYCNNCFRRNNDQYSSPRSPADSNGELENINKKLDKILAALEIK